MIRLVGVVWLVAAGLGAVTTLVFRDYSGWYVATLVSSAFAASVGLALFRRPSAATVLLSIGAGVAWAAMYIALAAKQADDVQAWTADALLALLGAAGALTAFRTRRQSA